MTNDDIIRMAMESGITRVMDESSYRWLLEGREPINEVFIKFAELVAAAEREACSKTCEEYARKYAKDDDDSKAQAWMMLQCAAAIRARGQE